MVTTVTDRQRGVRPRIGIFGIGLAAYWPQFPGLKEQLEGYQRLVEERVGRWAEVVSAGLVDSAPRAVEAGNLFQRRQVDMVYCYVGTYATSSQVLPAVRIPQAPVLVLNLQPSAALDYARTGTREWLANCCACCVPEIACAFRRCDVDFHLVSGMLREEPGCREPARRAWAEIREWTEAAGVLRTVRGSRIGVLGHVYPGMLDMYSDFTQHQGQLGTHVEILEMCDLAALVRAATEPEVKAKEEEALAIFELAEDSPSDPLAVRPTPEALAWACRVAVGLDKLAADHALDGLTYYYRGLDHNEYERIAAGFALGCSLLTSRGVPCSGEGDLKNCQAMKIVDSFGAGGSYSEVTAMDFREKFILAGHDGPFHLAISSARPLLRGLEMFHGKRGAGIGVETQVRHGPVTLLSMTQTRAGNLRLVAAQGESIPGPGLQIGNTDSRLQFSLGPAEFMDAWCHEGPTHHFALGVGHVLPRIEKFAAIAGLELRVVAA